MNDKFEKDLKDEKFDEYIQERIDLQRFNEMQKDKKAYVVENIVQKSIEKRALEEKRFLTWYLKYKLPFFKQYPYEQLSALTEKFSYHPESRISST